MEVISQLKEWNPMNLGSSPCVCSVLWLHQGKRPRARSSHLLSLSPDLHNEPLLVPRNPESPRVGAGEGGGEGRRRVDCR